MTNLMINDLAVESKDLDHSAMLAVRGGAAPTSGDLTSFNGQVLANEAKAGIAAIATGVNTLVSTNNLLNVNTDLNVHPVTNIVLGGVA